MYNGGELYLRSVHREWKRKKKRKGKWYKREHRITKAQRDRIETTVPVNFAGPIGFPVESREIRDEAEATSAAAAPPIVAKILLRKLEELTSPPGYHFRRASGVTTACRPVPLLTPE